MLFTKKKNIYKVDNTLNATVMLCKTHTSQTILLQLVFCISPHFSLHTGAFLHGFGGQSPHLPWLENPEIWEQIEKLSLTSYNVRQV